MFYRELLPAGPLRPYVRCYWMLERDYRDVPGSDESVWPDGRMELLFHYGARYTLGSADGQPLPHGFVIGPLTRCLRLASSGTVRLFGVRFQPYGFAPLFRATVSGMRDHIVDAESVLGADGRALQDRLSSADRREAVHVLEAFLLRRLRAADPPAASVSSLARDILRAAGRVHLGIEAEARGVSMRQLERRFKSATGLSPKGLATIARFDASRRHFLRHPEADLLDVTYRFGYADYSHFSKDFHRFLGVTPNAFRRWSRAAAGRLETSADVVFLQDEGEAPAHPRAISLEE